MKTSPQDEGRDRSARLHKRHRGSQLRTRSPLLFGRLALRWPIMALAMFSLSPEPTIASPRFLARFFLAIAWVLAGLRANRNSSWLQLQTQCPTDRKPRIRTMRCAVLAMPSVIGERRPKPPSCSVRYRLGERRRGEDDFDPVTAPVVDAIRHGAISMALALALRARRSI